MYRFVRAEISDGRPYDSLEFNFRIARPSSTMVRQTSDPRIGDFAATDDPSFTIIGIALAAGVLFGSRDEASRLVAAQKTRRAHETANARR
jgi:hypothetical protein